MLGSDISISVLLHYNSQQQMQYSTKIFAGSLLEGNKAENNTLTTACILTSSINQTKSTNANWINVQTMNVVTKVLAGYYPLKYSDFPAISQEKAAISLAFSACSEYCMVPKCCTLGWSPQLSSHMIHDSWCPLVASLYGRNTCLSYNQCFKMTT